MRIVSLFSGAGGLDLGLVEEGHDIVWANDIFLDAVETYRLNIGGVVDTRDINDVHESEIPDCDAVVGGFPCQGFSVANWGRQVDDSRNEMYKNFVRIVREKQPQFFVAENVRGLLSLGKGQVLEHIVSEFSQCGYEVQVHLVNAADYGVPQTRMRVLISGTSRDVCATLEMPPPATHAEPGTLSADSLPAWITVGEALALYPEPDKNSGIPNHEASKYKLRFNGYLGHRIIDPDRPAPTVTSRGDDRGGVVVLHHPNNKRRMSARELAAVQSFPDTFVFVGTKTSAYRQISNAVPPALGRAIGKALNEAASQETNNHFQGVNSR